MNRRSIALAAFILAFTIAALPRISSARVRVGTLSGVVLDANGEPVHHATVTMQTSYGDRPNATHTDSAGRFHFVRFRTGQYDLRAYSKGSFSPWVKRITIRANRTTEVTLRMPPAADVTVNVTR
ncbi:MAG: carboxypeptidase regulatory-like domain-containing protein [Acidobacteriota bacterium]|nr:carboxypeptidase regulatory-like domain-containing protein [Acidobacteriota bacterium]MDE3170440.1 carboxypeptidase regulatory-like domain-containing protein [Acidobacteriota bacterium]